jgi:ATPase components of ABC transporters with duplicated ATPase domains
MQIITISNVKQTFGERILFDIPQLTVEKGARIGVIGRNGSGKSTLLKMLAKLQTIETGTIRINGNSLFVPQIQDKIDYHSGGEKTKQALQNAFLQQPDILLLDEPTTNLDINNIKNIIELTLNYDGTLLIASHDRAYLDKTCQTIWEISERTIKVFSGNYTNYLEQKVIDEQTHEKKYQNYVKEKQKIEKAITQKKVKAAKATKISGKKVSQSEAKITGAKPYFAKKQKKLEQVATSMTTRLEKLVEVEQKRTLPPIKMTIPMQSKLARRPIIQGNENPLKIQNKVLIKQLKFTISGGEKLAIIGANGVGKTTLIKAIVSQGSQIQINPQVRIGYFSQSLDILAEDKTVLENVMSTNIHDETLARIVLARLHFFQNDIHKQVKLLSGGEQVKLTFAKLFLSDINVLILDEPTNYLDINAMQGLEQLLLEYEGTLIFISHDTNFVETLATRILLLENQTLKSYATFAESITPKENSETKITKADKLLLDVKIAALISELSINPNNPEMEAKLNELLAIKNVANK